ncbi:MAG: metallophosphoesterase family protein [Anaerolineae bacterium]|nr:metallophosphoesterase family protein [Anaerolineae bacterium]
MVTSRRVVDRVRCDSPIVLPRWQRIGVVADTHVPHRLPALPAQVLDLLRDCDVILHAGDLESPEILAQLGRIAPTYAVRGNLHWQYSTGTHDQDLPLSLCFRAGPHCIWMTHGHLRFRFSLVDKVQGWQARRQAGGINRLLIARLAVYRPRDANIVIFGHSHRSCAVWHGGVLFFNPGSVCALSERAPEESARVGVLCLHEDGHIEPTWRLLSAQVDANHDPALSRA